MEYKYTLVSGEPGKVPSRKGFPTLDQAAEAWGEAVKQTPQSEHEILELETSDVMELVDTYATSCVDYLASYRWNSLTARDRDILRAKMEEAQEELRATIEGLLK